MSERLQKILLYAVAAPGVFLLFFLLGVYWTFPYEHVRDFIVQEAERGSDLQLEITSLEPDWVTGIEATGVRVAMPTEGSDGPPAELLIREASARVSLLSLMAGSTDVGFETALDGGGRIDGNYADDGESVHLETQLSNLDLRRLGPLRAAVGLPISGRAEGNVDMTIGQQAANTEGTVQITVRNLAVADGETPLQIEGLGSGLTLERMNLGTLQFQMETERGAGRIQRLHADGEDAELWGSGSIRLVQPLSRSSIDMLIRIDFKDAYKESSPRMQGLFALLEVNPQVRPARTPNGALQWRIQGSFGGRIRMVPSGRTPMPEAD